MISKKERKLYNSVMYLAFFTTLSLIIIMCFTVCPVKVLDVYGNITTDKEIYKAGETVTYTADYCKYKQIPAIGSHALVDGIIIPYSKIETNVPVGCDKLVMPLKIPEYAPSGEYYLQIDFNYHVNPFKDVSYTFETERFIIQND